MVDDITINRFLAVDLLDRLGIAAAEAENGAEALAAVTVGAFDLVLMDIQMPVMDGIAATTAIRALGSMAATIPILAVSASYAAYADQCLAAGMNALLPKPLTTATLTDALTIWLPAPRAGEN